MEKDVAKTAEYYRKAAEEGDAAAQYTLGFAYHFGKGVAKDYAEAARRYRKAAEQGDIPAEMSLGEMKKRGGYTVRAFARRVFFFF
jgi:TPR repeat protein